MEKMLLDHKDSACHILDAIASDLRKFIDAEVDHYGTDADYSLIRPIELNQTAWVTEEPFTSFEFELDHFKGNLLSLSNVFEVAHGAMFADLFVREVGVQLREMIQARFTVYLDKQMQEHHPVHVEWRKAV